MSKEVKDVEVESYGQEMKDVEVEMIKDVELQEVESFVEKKEVLLLDDSYYVDMLKRGWLQPLHRLFSATVKSAIHIELSDLPMLDDEFSDKLGHKVNDSKLTLCSKNDIRFSAA